MGGSSTVLSYMSGEDILREADRLMLFTSRDGRVITVNDQTCTILGRTAGEVIGRNWFSEFVEPEIGESSAVQFRDHVAEAGRETFEQEYPVLSAGGGFRPCTFRNRVVRDEDGIVMCIMIAGHMLDHPAGSTGEEAPEEGIYRTMINDSVHGILMLQGDPPVIRYASAPAGKMLGTDADELTAMEPSGVRGLFSEEAWETISSGLSGTDAEGSRKTVELMLYDSGGNPVWTVAMCSATEHQGNPALQLTMVDISATRRTIQALSESEEKYRTLVENSSDAIVIHRDGVIVFANTTAMTLTGFDEEELLGNSVLNFVSHDYEALVLRNMTNRISGKDVPPIYNIEILRKDGGNVPVEINVSEIHYEGDRSYMILIRDLSDRQELEGQLRQAQKMEAVGQLAGGVAHDFNNILQVINGYTELADAALEEDHPVREMINQISKAGERAGELVHQLLLFSRNQVIVTSIMDLNQIVSEHLSMLRRIIGEETVIELEACADPVYVNADHSMMGQILLNICLNARDAMPDGGRIAVNTDRIYLNSEFCESNPSAKPGYYGVLSIADTGYGMDEETLGRIFEPFFSTKGISAGTGLGLSTVYGIVTQHDGLIKVESTPGEGSVFMVYLPVADRSIEIEEIPQEYELMDTTSRTIVIAEDDEDVRNLACEVLAEAGHEVITAADGSEAVVLVNDSPESVDLVILDAIMPVMNGFTAADKIREVRPDMPIIFCSGYSRERNSEDIMRFRENSRFLLKPYSMAQLLTAMNELFSGQH